MTAETYIEKLLHKEERVLVKYNTLMNLCLGALNTGDMDDLEYYMEGERSLTLILTDVTKTRNSFFAEYPKAGQMASRSFPGLSEQRVQMHVSLQEVISRLKKGMARVQYDLKNVNIPKERVSTVQTGPTLIDIEA